MTLYGFDLSAALAPYILLVIFGFLPSEVWRFVSVFLVQGLDEKSEILIWVRAVATALLAGIVAKILLHPSGALQIVPLFGRAGALGLAIVVFFITKRGVIPAVLAGEAALLFLGWWFA